jgi:CheY-like chemotaxis protein
MELRKHFDVIFMDSVMPGMDGPTATAAIRAAGYLSPIFGVTGNALDREVANFMASGVDTVFTKPVDTIRLFDSIILLRQNKIIDVPPC